MIKKSVRGWRILLLEDNPRDVELVTGALQTADPAVVVVHVGTKESFVRAIEERPPDAIISDHAVNGFSARDALRIVGQTLPECPFFLFSGAVDRTTAECLKEGALDFIAKSELARLAPAIKTALEMRAPLRTLSRRQREVLHFLIAGLSTRNIAEQLQLSVKTVESHRAQVLKRLVVPDLVALVRYAMHVGLLK